jgi:hypothetical protein
LAEAIQDRLNAGKSEFQQKERTTMKLKRMFLIVGVLGLLLLSVPAALPDQPIHSVTGSGLVDLRNDPEFGFVDVVFRTNVAVHQFADGRLQGNVQGIVYRLFGPLPHPRVFHAEPTCLFIVNGNTAYIGAVITQSNVPGAVGKLLAVGVKDVGGPGQDRMHFEFAEDLEPFGGAPVNCGSFPWPEVVLNHLVSSVADTGNYQVR